MIETPLLYNAFTEALRAVHEEKRDAVTLEGAAMAYSYQAGATKVLSALFTIAEAKKPAIGISPRKLRQ